jgi:hypothetical protein
MRSGGPSGHADHQEQREHSGQTITTVHGTIPPAETL